MLDNDEFIMKATTLRDTKLFLSPPTNLYHIYPLSSKVKTQNWTTSLGFMVKGDQLFQKDYVFIPKRFHTFVMFIPQKSLDRYSFLYFFTFKFQH